MLKNFALNMRKQLPMVTLGTVANPSRTAPTASL